MLLTGLAGAATIGGSMSAAAQGLGLPWETTTTTAAPPQQTTTTAAPAPAEQQTTTTTSPTPTLFPAPTPPPEGEPPSDAGDPPPSDEGPGEAPDAQPHAGDGGTAPAGAGAFPPDLQALMNSIRRTSANNTKALAAALVPLQQFGLSEVEAAVVGFGRFPIAGVASYSHDWWFPRFGPGWRLHQGTDIFAAHGTPVRAPVDGTVKITNSGLGGLSVYIVQPDGTYWYLAHLAGIPEGLVAGATVKTGDVVGFVGDSGNARGGPPHVHFEVHPGGGRAIDPKPVLDQFIADALALAPRVVEAYANAAPGTAPAQVVVPAPAAQPAAAALPPRAALLWTTAVSPTGGAVHLAEVEAARVASSIDWAARELDDGPTAFDRRIAQQYAAWWVQPLVHPRLARHLRLG